VATSSRAQGCEHCPGSHTGELPCLATATSEAGGWLMVEHPGPWPEEIEDLDLPEPVAAALDEAARRGIRRQLIRRPGRRRMTPPLQVYAGHTGAAWLEGRELADPADLTALDLAAVAAGRPPGFGERVAGPVLLVCTHGRHNVCCARTGGPLARALRTRFGAAVWETTHVGGERYAPNLVCLPHGLYYGSLRPAEAVAAVEAYQRGEVMLDRLRGRAGLPEPAQAAEHFVRAHTGISGVDAVTVESVTGGPLREAVVMAGGERYRLVLRPSTLAAPCGPACAENLSTYLLEDMGLLNGVALV
jgi:hypothetical protein